MKHKHGVWESKCRICWDRKLSIEANNLVDLKHNDQVCDFYLVKEPEQIFLKWK